MQVADSHPEAAMWVPLKSRWHRLPGEPAPDAQDAERVAPADEDVAEVVQARGAKGDAEGDVESDTRDAGART